MQTACEGAVRFLLLLIETSTNKMKVQMRAPAGKSLLITSVRVETICAAQMQTSCVSRWVCWFQKKQNVEMHEQHVNNVQHFLSEQERFYHSKQTLRGLQGSNRCHAVRFRARRYRKLILGEGLGQALSYHDAQLVLDCYSGWSWITLFIIDSCVVT